MLNGLDLFSGIGGLTLALSPWVRPVAYCENERYAAAVLLSRMADGSLPVAPIWDDVQTLRGASLPRIDIIYGGFPCQDISSAGRGAGLEGKRSGLYFELLRLVRECRPSFVFLENVPAILTRGGIAVIRSLTEIGYDCRWTILSAADVGAPHLRKRWWLLAHSRSAGRESGNLCYSRDDGRETCEGLTVEFGESSQAPTPLAYSESVQPQQQSAGADSVGHSSARTLPGEGAVLADTPSVRPQGRYEQGGGRSGDESRPYTEFAGSSFERDWWAVEPDVGRVAHGVPARSHRLRGLGNAVVPLCARTAFEILSGLRGVA